MCWINWKLGKPWLSNYKSHITKKRKSCSIVKHLIDSCTDTVNPYKCLRFISIDCLTDTENSSKEEFNDLLLEKEIFWIRTLCTIHKDLNDYHDWWRSEWIKTLTLMIGENVVKLVSIFPGLDFFYQDKKLVSTYWVTCFHMKNKFNPANVLIRKTVLEIIIIIIINLF